MAKKTLKTPKDAAKRLRVLETKAWSLLREFTSLAEEMRAANLSPAWVKEVDTAVTFSGRMSMTAWDMEKYPSAEAANLAARVDHWNEVWRRADFADDTARKEEAERELEKLGSPVR